jgi:hypothetical protein
VLAQIRGQPTSRVPRVLTGVKLLRKSGRISLDWLAHFPDVTMVLLCPMDSLVVYGGDSASGLTELTVSDPR